MGFGGYLVFRFCERTFYGQFLSLKLAPVIFKALNLHTYYALLCKVMYFLNMLFKNYEKFN